ncbi:MAG: ABC transporter permease [Phycisphaeraceae bacterium]
MIRPAGRWQVVDLAELWHFRDLLFMLAKRDILVRYKQTALGLLWAVLQPVITMGVLSLVLGQFIAGGKIIGDTPYSLFLFAGLLPWLFFAAAVNAAGSSLVSNAGMLQKVYFPRMIVPLAAMGAPLMDAAVASGVLVVMLLWYQPPMQATILLAPLAGFTLLIAAVGIGLLLAAWTVSYRDFRHVVPFMLQVWFFITPILVPASVLPRSLAWFNQINPVAGAIGAWRAALLGWQIDYAAWAVSLVMSLALLATGVVFFTHTQRRFADTV